MIYSFREPTQLASDLLELGYNGSSLSIVGSC